MTKPGRRRCTEGGDLNPQPRIHHKWAENDSSGGRAPAKWTGRATAFIRKSDGAPTTQAPRTLAQQPKNADPRECLPAGSSPGRLAFLVKAGKKTPVDRRVHNRPTPGNSVSIQSYGILFFLHFVFGQSFFGYCLEAFVAVGAETRGIRSDLALSEWARPRVCSGSGKRDGKSSRKM